MNDDRLYGLPGAEILYADIGTVWEADIEPYGYDDGPGTWTIEEWTVTPPIDHLPSAADIACWLAEMAADDQGLDDSGDAWDDAMKHEDVHFALELLRATIANQMTYRSAADKVADHTLTIDDQGQPLLDGQPLYLPAEGDGR